MNLLIIFEFSLKTLMLRINTILFTTNKYYNVLLERKMQVESESQKRVTTIDSYLIQ